MKRILSVLLLWTGRLVRQEAALLLLLFFGETALFLPPLLSEGALGLETVLAHSHVALAALGAYALLCGWVYYIAGGAGNGPGFTLSRLSISPAGGAACRWASFSAAYLTFWGVQAGLALWLCFLWQWLGPAELQNPQTVLLAFYRNSFFHGLLPLADRMVWLRNLVFCLALGASAAGGSRVHQGQFLFAAVAGALQFPVETGNLGNIAISLAQNITVILLSAGIFLWKRYEEAHGNEAEPDPAERA